MSGYTAHNSKVFKAGLNDYAERVIKAKLEAMLRGVAEKLVAYIDGGFTPPSGTMQFPVDTGNLHDATGVGVYIDGRLSAYLPTVIAVERQTNRGEVGIDGSIALRNAVQAATTRFSKGIWIVLFSTVSYAYKINTQGSPRGRGVGFFDGLGEVLFQNVITGLQPISATAS